jgi:hypothetical protein
VGYASNWGQEAVKGLTLDSPSADIFDKSSGDNAGWNNHGQREILCFGGGHHSELDCTSGVTAVCPDPVGDWTGWSTV